MNTRRWTMAVVALLAVVLLVGSAGVAALAAGNMGPWSDASTPAGMMGRYGPTGPMGGMQPGGMMGGNGPGMMGGNGPGMGSGMGPGMMGGSSQGSQGQTPSGSPTTGVTQVTIQNFAFAPASIAVPVGTTVTWTNQDSTPHTVTFRNGMKDSGMLRQGQTFGYTSTSAGTFPYYCAYHPSMTGTVTVTS